MSFDENEIMFPTGRKFGKFPLNIKEFLVWSFNTQIAFQTENYNNEKLQQQRKTLK